MGLCQSDPRDHSKTITVEIKPSSANQSFPNPPPDANLLSQNSASDSKTEHAVQDSDYLFRTNINLNDLHPELQGLSKERETYMHLQLPHNLNAGFTNSCNSNNVPLGTNMSFARTDNVNSMDENRKSHNENPNLIIPRPSIYHRRVSHMASNPLANMTSNNNGVRSQNVLPYEETAKLQITENSNEEDIPKRSTLNNRGLTSKFLVESSFSMKKSHDYTHEGGLSRFLLHQATVAHESRVFGAPLEEMIESVQEDLLYVITLISNPCQSSLKAQHYTQFAQKMEGLPNVRLITVEVAYMSLPFVLTQPHYEPYNIQIRVQTPLNLKYNLLNHVISVLPAEAEFVAWIDPNIEFLNEDWFEDTLDTLKTASFVKLYKDCLLINKDGNILGSTTTLIRNPKNIKAYNNTERIVLLEKYSGTAWAARKDFITSIGGFLDLCVTNECDEIMNACLEGKVEEVLPEGLAPEFRDILKEWQRAIKANSKSEDVRALNNVIKKHVSEDALPEKARPQSKSKGPSVKEETRYKRFDGWRLLTDHHFNPLKDLARDERNVYFLQREKERMVKAFKEYYTHSNDLPF